MKKFYRTLQVALLIQISSIQGFGQEQDTRRNYVCYMKSEAISIDGLLNETSWEAVPWSLTFLDIEGAQNPKPTYETKMKMLWDEDFLYIGVHLEEPDLWATYTERESVIFHENDIEVFLDPDGDTHHYYELEVNAMGTEWDLMLTKPYRNGGKAINGWNINGLRKAIHLEGTLNDPRDTDKYWVIEMAIPWKALSQSGPSFQIPKDGEQWRINFSRVQWQTEPDGLGYQKRINPKTKKPFSENNWVWSSMGIVDMHLPHRWGFLHFSTIKAGEGVVPFMPNKDEPLKDGLRRLYELQRAYFEKHNKFAINLEELKASDFGLGKVEFEVSATRYKLSAPSIINEDWWHITEDSRIWKGKTPPN
jgi:hypothetical protein